MVKKSGLVITMSIVLVFSIANIFLFFNTGDASYNSISGKFVQEIPALPFNLNISLIAFVIQWIILVIIAIVAYTRFVKKRGDEHLKISYNDLSKRRGKFETDFDTFYKLIQKRQKMRIGSVAKAFEITEEQALEWSKILEDNNLVTIEYPAFYDPEVRIKQKNEEVKNEKNKKEGGKQKDGKEGDGKEEVSKGKTSLFQTKQPSEPESKQENKPKGKLGEKFAGKSKHASKTKHGEPQKAKHASKHKQGKKPHKSKAKKAKK